MYYKGGNMLHMIRQIMGDSAYRGMLHGLNRTFYHQTVTTGQIESYMSQYAGKDFSKIFDQYLRTTQIPVLTYQTSGDVISYRWGELRQRFQYADQSFCRRPAREMDLPHGRLADHARRNRRPGHPG